LPSRTHSTAQHPIRNMGWFSNFFQRGEQTPVGDGAYRQKLLQLGMALEIPELVRSTSSNTSLDSTSSISDSLFSYGQQQQPLHESVPKKETGGASFLQVLEGVNRAVEAHSQTIDATPTHACNATSGAVSTSLAVNTPPAASTRRSICPHREGVASHFDTVQKEKASLSWRSQTMETFPKTCFRISRYSTLPKTAKRSPSRNEKESSDDNTSVSFSACVHVLEFERDIVQYSSPEWSQYFSS
jgi:hypothetical protein